MNHSYQLFDYYPVSGVDLKSAAENTRTRVTNVHTVLSQLEQDHRTLMDGVEGELEGAAANAPTAAVTNANTVVAEAEYAASCLELFGTHLDTYNHISPAPRSIDKLNQAYRSALSGGFGVEYETPPADATTAESQAAYDDYYQAYTDARQALEGQLLSELGRLDGQLDDDAQAVGTMIEAGPTDANIETLWGAGVLPPYAPILYPGADLDGYELPEDARAELLQYLIDHPEVLINTPASLAAMIATLPTELQTDIEVERRMEQLRRAGLLDGDNPGGLYEEWVRNTVDNGVSADTLLEIAEDHDVTPESFDVLDGLQEINDPDGKSFFVLDTDMSGSEAADAVLMTYILNAGTDYEGGDFDPTAYSSDEIQRIIDRQGDNDWSYDEDVAFVHDNGGSLVTTPNGMLMGAGGNEIQDLFSQQAGTTWGDIFMLGEDDVDDPVAYLEQMIESGDSDVHEDLDLDRLLHHEERHSQQWAEYGYADYIVRYLDASTDLVWDEDWGPFGHPEIQTVDGEDNEYEVDAGLEDGGY